MKIIIVDDDWSILKAFRRVLEKLGHEVITTSFMEGTIRGLEKGAEAVFLDYDLGISEYNGTSIIDYCSRAFPNVVWYANSNDEESNQKLLEAGCKDITGKNREMIKEIF
jgi:DNA-binding response OmpR family regulator